MKFSLLIANYNNGKFFRDCYYSILTQTHQDWEAVIVDDASTDNSMELIRECVGNDSRFRIFQNEKNEGVGFTKGKLIELAEGEFCGYLDPDDAILPDAVSASVSVFKKEKDVVLTYSRLIKCDHDLKPLAHFKAAMQVPNGNLNWFNCPVQIAPFVGFRKNIYLQCEKMNPALRIAEDQDLYFKMYEKGKVRFIDQSDYLYRAHEGGISQNDNKEKSYEYFAQAILQAMKRRGLTKINGKKIPSGYSKPNEVFDLLAYQNSVPHRIIKKLKVLLQK